MNRVAVVGYLIHQGVSHPRPVDLIHSPQNVPASSQGVPNGWRRGAVLGFLGGESRWRPRGYVKRERVALLHCMRDQTPRPSRPLRCLTSARKLNEARFGRCGDGLDTGLALGGGLGRSDDTILNGHFLQLRHHPGRRKPVRWAFSSGEPSSYAAKRRVVPGDAVGVGR